MKKILSNRMYLLILLSDLASNFGDVVYYLALMNYVIYLPKPGYALSIISLSETLPVLTGFLVAYWSSRFRHKIRAIQVTLLIRFALFAVLGVVMTFEPALWIVMVAAGFNFLADMAGQFENFLYIPLSLRVISDEDRAAFTGFGQGIRLVAHIVFQSSGAILIAVMSYSQLAWVNALTFLVPLFVIAVLRSRFEALLADRPLVMAEQVGSRQIWQSFKSAFKEMKTIPGLQSSMVMVPFLNGVLSVFTIVLTLVLSEHQSLAISSPTSTLAICQIIGVLGSILGSLGVVSLLKDISMRRLLQISMFVLVGLTATIFLQQIYLLLICYFGLGLLSGALTPKLSALVMNSISEEKLPTVIGGIETYFQVGTMLMQLLVSGLVLVLSSDQISLILFLLSLTFLGYTISNH